MPRLRRSHHGPYIDLLQPVVTRATPTPSSPSSPLTASGGTSEAAAGRPCRALCATDVEFALLQYTTESPKHSLQEGTGLVRWLQRSAKKQKVFCRRAYPHRVVGHVRRVGGAWVGRSVSLPSGAGARDVNNSVSVCVARICFHASETEYRYRGTRSASM